MNILVLGSGGREHALSWKLAQSPACEQLFIAPGNAGTSQVGTNLPVDIADHAAIRQLIDTHQIDLLVIGPEQPLVDGLVDALEDHAVKVVGPSQTAAQLEGSKDFSKAFMARHDIPTARYRSFNKGENEEAMNYLADHPLPIVVKASGLAAGKGVVICETVEHAQQVTHEMLSGDAFGSAGETVVIEEFLNGIEISIFVLADGSDYVILPSAKDYKRIGEGDTGLNTGGMGAVSPVPFADQAFVDQVEATIIRPTLQGMKAEAMPFTGFLFIGLMVVDGVPKVLEYNVRMGDPETEVVMPRLQSDFAELCLAAAEGRLADFSLNTDPRTCVTVMLVSGGYPGKYEKGKTMNGFEKPENVTLFHAGTKRVDGQVVTNGGRVLAVSAFGKDISEAVGFAKAGAELIEFEGKFFRRDIGQDLM